MRSHNSMVTTWKITANGFEIIKVEAGSGQEVLRLCKYCKLYLTHVL